MIYHFSENRPELTALKALNAHAVVSEGLIQWHRGDYTVVAQASYAILGRYVKVAGEFEQNEQTSAISQAQAAELVAALAGKASWGESDQDGIVTYYKIWDVRSTPRDATFPDEATALVEAFVGCVSASLDEDWTDEDQATINTFLSALDSFLAGYKNLTLDDVARYVSKVGVSQSKARRDLEAVLALRES